MAQTEALQILFRRSLLPEEVSDLLRQRVEQLGSGDFEAILSSEEIRALLQNIKIKADEGWMSAVSLTLTEILKSAASDEKTIKEKTNIYFILGYASLLAFLQTTITGPPLAFSSSKVLFPAEVANDAVKLAETRKTLVAGLSVDGVAAFRLLPSPELLSLAKAILENEDVVSRMGVVGQWARLRVRFAHQRILGEAAGSLETAICSDLDSLDEVITEKGGKAARVQFLLERASIETYHGLDKRAREDLDEAAKGRGFLFALTGLLGRRTKFQQHDISQLVVLAKSANDTVPQSGKAVESNDGIATGPKNFDLNDDTLLESISFTETPTLKTDIQDLSTLPKELTELDPAQQPLLDPLDSIILLALASSITNTSPADGLTREETIPYAVRVLEGGSSNWQVYTQALLVRSRIEGYKTRTVERGLLQLQALVDQVIADTSSTEANSADQADGAAAGATSFLPRASESESAPASDRLTYIFQLASPSRWDLESELAQRWVQLGGLRSALEIYERLEMWAEAALCYAATEKEETAKRMIRRQLFHTTAGVPDALATEDETWQGEERVPPPGDAPRLWCLLGDIDNDPAMYEKAWEVSKQRYARAQRSLGRYWLSARDALKAADAYAKSLRVNQLNQQSWFAMGCALLELAQFEKAAESFRRVVQLDETDAEAWSNLAAALLKNEVPEASTSADASMEATPAPASLANDDDEEEEDEENVPAPRQADPQQNRLDALRALKRAATLKHDSHRIWENLLIVAASVNPPDYATILTAQRHLISLRGKTVGEACIDVDIMGAMVRHVMGKHDVFDREKPGYERLLVEVFDKQITPLITSSAALWNMVARLALWRQKPERALEAHEKAWRAVTTQPGWETGSEKRWDGVVEATVELCDAYESLGPREKTEGLAAGSGNLVAKDWKFKARSAVRGIMGRGKDSWEDTEGWARLKDVLDQLKG